MPGVLYRTDLRLSGKPRIPQQGDSPRPTSTPRRWLRQSDDLGRVAGLGVDGDPRAKSRVGTTGATLVTRDQQVFANVGVRRSFPRSGQRKGTMKLSELSPRDRVRAVTIRDLVSLGDFLGPEIHRTGGIDLAASAVREWADDDVAMIEEAETIASNQHRDYSAEILHRAKLLATLSE
jgi:hypothetical protein